MRVGLVHDGCDFVWLPAIPHTHHNIILVHAILELVALDDGSRRLDPAVSVLQFVGMSAINTQMKANKIIHTCDETHCMMTSVATLHWRLCLEADSIAVAVEEASEGYLSAIFAFVYCITTVPLLVCFCECSSMQECTRISEKHGKSPLNTWQNKRI